MFKTFRREIRVGAVLVGAAVVTTMALAGGPASAAGTHELASPTHPFGGRAYLTKEAHAANGSKPNHNNLSYGGGVDGIGVTTGSENVYVIFWGSQWGAAGTDSSGYTTLSGDPSGMAPRLQAMYKGLGSNGELWSGVMTQYCEGTAKGSQTCGSGTTHVAYPSSNALAGVWVDNGAAAPSNATARQLGDEAVAAAGHFGNTTATANRDAQYIVVSPTGTHPDGFNTAQGNFCAWHDWNGDSYVGSPSSYGDIAFTNAPYVTDLGTSCGQNYVNGGTAGLLDGVTIVMGHEYSETITDQNPAGGWTDSRGYENADKCSWNGTGGTGGAQDITFSTGSFAMQGTWSNDTADCRVSHAIVY